MKSSRCVLILFCVLPVLVDSGCVNRTDADTAPVATSSSAWVRTELYFSIGDWSGTAPNTDAESKWIAFLDREVTPRFPDGLSVIDVYGQWRSPNAGSPILRERSRLLVILHPNTAGASGKIEAICETWKQATGEESVLWVDQPADVRF